MKVLILTVGFLVLAGGIAAAETPAKIKEETKGVFSTILYVLLKWVFPLCAAYCFIYGVVARGVKRGEWDMAAVCVLASVALALFPKILENLFGVKV